MISYDREPQTTIPTSSVKIIGLGGAGANMLERIALDGLEGAELLALNTDIRTLAGCVAGEKIQLGRNLTKGLGSGGDPDLGQQAILEAENEVRAALKGRRIVFLCTGLGGGTGSGAAPIVTRIAREEGAFVVVFATMPFHFEGRRRREQAQTALNELAVLSNALVTFDNNRMGELVLAKQGIHEAFSSADSMICESIKAVIRLVVRPGLINVGLDDLMSALRTTRSRCLFGSGIARGKDRAASALKNALSSPLLDQGTLLKEAQSVLVHLSGGEDLTLFEIELLMRGLGKYVPEKAHILFGAAVDPSMGDSLSITLISALPEDKLSGVSRDTFARASSTAPVLDPVESFTTLEPVKAPEPEPEPEPVAVKPEPAPQPPPVPEVVKVTQVEAPAPVAEKPKKTAAPAAASLFEERPFAEPAVEKPADVAPPEPEAEPEPVKPFLETPAKTAPEPAGEEAAFAFVGVPEHPKSVLPPNDPFADESMDLDPVEPEWLRDEPESSASPKEAVPSGSPEPLKLRAKTGPGQGELSFDGGPRGRFEGESPNVFEGEDLDVPPFLRKKR